MNTVILYGDLADKYGKEFKMAVRDPLEAMRALHVQLPGFLQMCEEKGYVAVREFANGAFALTKELLLIGVNHGTIHILPSVDGAKKGVGKIILGVAMIGVAFIPGLNVAAFGIAGAMTYSTLALTLGLGLLFAGAAMLLSPTPHMANGKDKKDQSFLFNGDTNTAAQDQCVPVTYGRDRVKPIPIATRVATNEYAVGSATGTGGLTKDAQTGTTSGGTTSGGTVQTGTNTDTSLGGITGTPTNPYPNQKRDTAYRTDS